MQYYTSQFATDHHLVFFSEWHEFQTVAQAINFFIYKSFIHRKLVAWKHRNQT